MEKYIIHFHHAMWCGMSLMCPRLGTILYTHVIKKEIDVDNIMEVIFGKRLAAFIIKLWSILDRERYRSYRVVKEKKRTFVSPPREKLYSFASSLPRSSRWHSFQLFQRAEIIKRFNISMGWRSRSSHFSADDK